MNYTNNITRIPVTYKFRLVVKSPVTADFGFEPLRLDVDRINKRDIEELEEVIFGYIDTKNTGTDDLYLETTLKFSIRNNNKYYLSFLEGNDRYRGPISHEKMLAMERAHKRLFFDLVTYIGWLVGSDFSRKDIGWERTKLYYSYDADGVKGDMNTNAPKYEFGPHYYFTSEEKINVTHDDLSTFYKMQNNKQAIPLHHELFIEAISLSKNNQNPTEEPTSSRSSFLILYTAMEVAVKSLVKKTAPDTDWIVKNSQSPPLVDILTQYMGSSESQMIAKAELEAIRSIAIKRNNIAHNGEEVAIDTLNKYIEIVRKWLIQIDVELGHGWIYDKPYRRSR